MFADDTTIYAAAQSITQLELLMQDDLHSLSPVDAVQQVKH